MIFHTFTAQLTNLPASTPLPGIKIHAQLIRRQVASRKAGKSEPSPNDLGFAQSDEKGCFSFCYELPENSKEKTVKIKLSFYIEEDKPFHQETVEIEVGSDLKCPIRLELPREESNLFFIQGQLLNAATGEALPKYRVQLTLSGKPKTGGALLSTRSDQEGLFSFSLEGEGGAIPEKISPTFSIFHDSDTPLHQERREITIEEDQLQVFAIEMPEAPKMDNYRFSGWLVDKDSQKSLSGVRVHARIASRKLKASQELALTHSDGKGRFTVDYQLPKEHSTSSLRLSLEIFIDEETPFKKQLQIKPGDEETIAIEVLVPGREEIPITSIRKYVNIPAQLNKYLNDNNIRSLRDIAAIGGLARQEGLPVAPDSKAVGQLDAHAQLGILSRDPEANARLIEAGYTTVRSITRTEIALFIGSLEGKITKEKAEQIHVTALATQGVITNVITQTLAGSEYSGGHDQEPLLVTGEEKEDCHCKDCEAMVKPRVYLADLLNYTLDYVKQEIRDPLPKLKHIDLEFLQNTFFQPFRDIPSSCDAQEDKMCQKRIATEVLCAYIQSLDSSDVNQTRLAQGEKEYWISVYQALLRQLGTNYDEIRTARYADQEERKRLADRLGISLNEDGSRPDHLDDLFIDVKTFPADQGEPKLESLFSYRNTKRNPLSATPTGEFEQWRLAHLRKLWQKEDWLRDDYTEGADNRLPAIDPDIIGIDDLRRPVPGNDIYDLWKDRRTWIDELITSTDNFNLSTYRGAFDNNTKLFIPGRDLTVEIEATETIAIIITDTDAGTESVQSGTVEAIEYKNEGTLIKLYPAVSIADPTQEFITHIEFTRKRAAVLDGSFTILTVAYENLEDEIIAAGQMEVYDGNTSQGTFTTFDFGLQFDFPSRNTNITISSGTFPAGDQIRYQFRVEVGAVILDLERVLKRMKDNFDYQGANKTIWASAVDIAQLIPIRNEMAQGVDIDTNTTTIQDDYKLEVDAFLRLAELYEKYNKGFVRPDNEPLTQEEEQEVLSILVHAIKKEFYDNWVDEEDNMGPSVLLNNEDFLIALREPEEGFLPISVPADTPLIDPDQLNLKDLPERHAATINHWNTIKDQLAALIVSFGEQYQDFGFDSLLEYSLNAGSPIQGDTAQYWTGLVTDLESADQKRIEWAKGEITANLFLSLEDFLFIDEVRKTDAVPLQSPSPEDLLSVYQRLLQAHKRKYLFTQWRNDEDTSPLFLTDNYWFAVKARLPKWRASAAERMRWQEALKRRLELPIIDPDIVQPKDFVEPTSGIVFDAWDTRWHWVDDELNALAALHPNLDQMLFDILGVSLNELKAIRDREAMGEKIAGRLEQLTLGFSSFRFLSNIIDIWENDPNLITDTEWSEVDELLVQAKKQRNYHRWHLEEKSLSITLSQDYFKIPDFTLSTFPLDAEAERSRWLYSWRNRKQWQRKLKNRIEQEQTIRQGIQAAIEEAEDITLHILRDAFIESVALPGETLSMAAKRLTDLLLIDLQDNCCKKVTWVSQAIVRMQLLLWSLRTQQLKDTYPDILLVRDHFSFDEEWKWLGSYASWRAAMFVFIYPQNLLYPTLRRKQTPGFLNLVKKVRGNKRFTPEHACEAARAYSDYYKDIAHLEVATTVDTTARIHEGGCNGQGKQYENLFFKFARSPISGKVYWSATEPGDYLKDTFWEELEEVEGEVLEVFGATVYRRLDDHHIYLFYKRTKEEDRVLSFIRYDLEKHIWDSPIDLETPKEGADFQAVVKQSHLEDEAPSLVVQYDSQNCYLNKLNAKGDDWEREEWHYRSLDWYFIKAWVAINASESVLIAQGFGGDTKIYYNILGGNYEDGGWYFPHDSARNFAGAWYGKGGGEKVYVFYKPTTSSPLAYFIISRQTTFNSRTFSPANSTDFDDLFGRIKEDTGFLLGHVFEDYAGKAFLAETNTSNFISLLKKVVSSPAYVNSISISFGSLSLGLESDPLLRYLHRHINLIVSKTRDKESVWYYTDQYLRRFSNCGSLGGLFRRLIGVHRYFIYPSLITLKLRERANEITYGGLAYSSSFTKIVHSSGAGNTDLNKTRTLSLAFTDGSRPRYGKILVPVFSGGALSTGQFYRIQPKVWDEFDISGEFSSLELQARKVIIEDMYTAHQGNSLPQLEYLKEAYFHVPFYLANQLCQRGHFIEALDWSRTIYDYSQELPNRKIYYGLVEEESLGFSFTRNDDWLQDPLNPHAIAATRRNTYTEFTILSLAKCMLAYADAEFTMDTAESVPRARILYTTALELLSLLKPQSDDCSTILGTLNIEVGDPYYEEVWHSYIEQMTGITGVHVLGETVDAVLGVMGSALPIAKKMSEVGELVAAALEKDTNKDTLQDAMAKNEEYLNRQVLRIAYHKEVAPALEQVQAAVVTAHQEASGARGRLSLQPASSQNGGQLARVSTPYSEDTPTTHDLIGKREYQWANGYYEMVLVPAPNFEFCVPPNPVIEMLCLKAEVNLFKIRNCMNIAGVVRELEPYAAPTDTTSGLPQIGAGGSLQLPGAFAIQPTQYRYPVLIERAKQLVGIAQQVEAAFLAALEKRDAEYYNLMKAKQDLALSKAGIKLQTLRVKEAESGVDLAELQTERARLQVQGLQDILDEGLLQVEETLIQQYFISATLSGGISAANFLTGLGQVSGSNWASEAVNKGLYLSGAIPKLILEISQAFLQASIQKNQILASWERRKQDLEFQKSLASQDIKIGQQQVKVAEQHVRVVNQEKVISEMQNEFAQETVEFLTNKFTNVELYDWMSGVLEGVYAHFLQEATAMAHLAANQLAFERQEVPPPFIQNDYWETPTDSAIIGNDSNGVDRRGLTGSARLLQDIHQLDQYAFDTDQRKLQITKTISLATLAPIQFQQFKETGAMVFGVPMESFDRDFPGHYLRLIKRVRTSVIALIPPVEGIKATLTNIGNTRVTIGGDIYQTVSIRKSPESIALTSPRDAIGLFELSQEGQFLNPFEGLGVDSFWEFRMEKPSNPIDYNTIADVLITIEYTALNSFDYRRQVIQNLDPFVSADRVFSFKNEFADQWYDLHHPDQTETPMEVRFQTFRSDFPPNVNLLKVKHLALYVVRSDGNDLEIEVGLNHSQVGEDFAFAMTEEGLISTRNGNGSAWTAFSGKGIEATWAMKFALANRIIFEEEKILDLLLVVTYEGEQAAYLT